MKDWIKQHANLKFSILFLFIGFICLFIFISGISYAYFVTMVKGKEMIIYTGTLSVDYSKKTNVISNLSSYPMSDSEGLKTNAHEFVVTNNGNIDARYQIRLELDDTITNMIDLKYVKLSYKIGDSSYSKPVLLSSLGSNLVFLHNNILCSGNSDVIGIKLWIDLDAGNDVQYKEFGAKIVVDSIQNVDDGYVVDTKPIIYLNKNENDSTDIHLKNGDNYDELGVARVDDDKDIITADQVGIDYEYYDGTSLSIVPTIDTSKSGIYYVNYSVVDSGNNIGKVTRVVTINDTDIIPSVTLNGDSTIMLFKGDNYVENGVTISDNSDVVTVGEVKTNVVGSYIVRYIVIDSNGNLNSIVRTVIVNSIYNESILNGTDPVITDNLVPVVISDTGKVTKADISSKWYSYEEKNWANAVILKDESISYSNNQEIPEDNIESYFVWIPRYKYQIFNEGNYTSLTSISNSVQTINVVFESKDVEPSTGSTVGSYLTHPAFTSFDVNGIWVGKFETGYDGATSTTDAQVNSVDTSKIIIKPNVYSWRSITVGNAFKNSYDYNRSLDSHMMKNTEWGAVAYLSHSKYGSQTSVRINNNSNYITGYSATEEPTLGHNNKVSIEGNRNEGTTLGVDGTYTVNYLNSSSTVSSTTGNYSGIYDMSGGAWEYVMGYTTSGSENDTSSITSLYPDFYNDSNYTKYWDKYTTKSIVGYNNRILGDATGEMGPFGNEVDPDTYTRYKTGWYVGFASFANSSQPWFGRGGAWYHGSSAGCSAFGDVTGNASALNSFRLVLAPTA